MLRGAPTFGRRVKLERSRVRIIWWTEGGLTPKWRCISHSAGRRRVHARIGIDEGHTYARSILFSNAVGEFLSLSAASNSTLAVFSCSTKISSL